MHPIILAGLLGAAGGAVRGIIGISKAAARKHTVVWAYAVFSLSLAVLVGIFAGIIFNFDYRISLLAGYAGPDLLEGAVHSITKKSMMERLMK